MKPDVISKLKDQLKKNISNEPQIVYILTRIGKIIEFENSKESYPVLNFYRNWSVHVKINNTKPVADILKEFIEKKEDRYHFSLHQQFRSELITFFKKHDLSTLNKSKLNNFIFYLGKVISDTPIEVVVGGQKYCISVSEPVKKNWSGLYTIFPLPYSLEGRENRAQKNSDGTAGGGAAPKRIARDPRSGPS